MNNSRKIHIVLHQTKNSGNIGSVCRAMGNMGADRLILVDCLCEVDDQARALAVGCDKILDQRIEYRNWQDFFDSEGEGLRIAFSARGGKERPTIGAEKLFAEICENQLSEFQNLYFAFGREDFGLSADDLQLFHQICHLTTHGEYQSLNLSHAVLLSLYLAKTTFGLKLKGQKVSETEIPPAALKYPSELIRQWLETLGFDLSAPRTNAYRVLNQLFLRNLPTQKELKILDAVLQQNIRKLKERTKDK